MRARTFLLALALLPSMLHAQNRDGQIEAEAHDPDTLAWWHRTEALANDRMAGREPGTPEYDRAAQAVADDWRASGLQPAGENGTYFQPVPLRKLDLGPGTRFSLRSPGAQPVELASLRQISIRLSPSTPASFELPLTFGGYCEAAQLASAAKAVAVCFRPHLGQAHGDTTAALKQAGVAGVLYIDDPSEPLEPPRWPMPTARVVTIRDGSPPKPQLLTLRLNWEALPALLAGTGHTAPELLAAAKMHAPLPSFSVPARLAAELKITARDFTSSNVLAFLPGTALPHEYLAVSAHLDGYGRGEPVLGDSIYNGALDDAAYVALLSQLATQKQRYQRSILFCAFTGEEEGLLGSEWFTRHPTVPAAELAADINLDQLRPLFPLKALTTLAITDSTLGPLARSVAEKEHIELRPDREPERGLLHRSDHWPFMGIGVPALGFIFGYDPGTDAERRYRTWYQVEYHRPQDDLAQPVDFAAARDFNRFFYALAAAVADAPDRPQWLPAGSPDRAAALAAH